MAAAKKKGLGKGLGALIGPVSSKELLKPPPKKNPKPIQLPVDDEAPTPVESVPERPDGGDSLLQLDPHEIRHNPKQPRQVFDEDLLEELAQSIRRDGLIQPVVVRFHTGLYELVSGERRVRAAILAELDRIPAIVREVSDREMLKLGLIENIQRKDLNPIETAQAYKGLIEEFEWTHDELANEVGKKRETVSNTLRLLNLEPEVRQAVCEGKISMGHARALLAFTSPLRQSAACRKIIEEGLSVRQTEKLASPNPSKPTPAKPSATKDPHLSDLEDTLRRRLGTQVAITSNEEYRGKIEVDFYNLDDLERILDLLRG